MAKKLLKKIGIISLISSMVISTFISCGQESGSEGNGDLKKIGIIQIVEHEALDSSREGFIKALESKGYVDGENIKIDYQNAQNDKNNLNLIAKNFQTDNKDLILAIATQSAQAVSNLIKDKPILITAVTDPVDAGLVNTLENPGTNVSGTSDISPIEKQFALLKELVPDAKKVGVLYNTSEANSIVLLDIINDVAPGMGLEIVAQGVTNTNEVAQAVDSIIDKVDVFYVPTDNTIVSSIALVTKKATEKNKAVIGSEAGQVEGGALATEGLDYYELGFQTGLMAVSVLEGEDISKMPVETQKDTKLLINQAVAAELKIEISKDLLARAEEVK